MRAFGALLGVSFKSLLLTSMNVGSRKRKKAATGIGALLLMAVLVVYLSATQSFLLGAALGPLGMLDLMLMAIALMGLVFTFTITVFSGQSLVYSTKDMDLVFSLPVSSFVVMLARLMALWIQTAIMMELFMIPAGAAWLVNGGGGGAGFMVLLVLETLLLSFIPTTLTLVFGGLVSLLVSCSRFKNLFTILLSLGLMVLIFAFSFTLSFRGSDMSAIDFAGIRAVVVGAVPPLAWIAQAVAGPSLPAWLGVAAITMLPFLAVVWVFSRFYKKILTRLSSHHMRADYKLGRVKAGGSLAALLGKEARRFFGTPAYFLNSGIGSIIIIVVAVLAIVNKNTILSMLEGMVAGGGAALVQAYLGPLLLAAVAFFGAIILTSAVSISLEGKTLWILKEAPVSAMKVFAAKAGFNFLLCAVTLVVSLPLLGIAFALPPGHVALMLLAALLLSLLTSMLGLYINLLMPRLDAENETIVIKQSASMVVTMLLAFVLVGLLVGLFVLLNALGLGAVAFYLISSGLLALLCLGVYALLRTKGQKLFHAL